MVRFSRVRLAAVLMCPPSVIRCCMLMRHNGGNTLKSQDHHEGLRALPLKAMECDFLHSLSPGRSPQWGQRLGSAQAPLDGAVAGLKAKLAFPPSDFALLHDALFSMSWHASP